tara:strand:+ start:1219 stop:1758 length:540 start_codon:yes stop_codon:yes gene_type:complete
MSLIYNTRKVSKMGFIFIGIIVGLFIGWTLGRDSVDRENDKRKEASRKPTPNKPIPRTKKKVKNFTTALDRLQLGMRQYSVELAEMLNIDHNKIDDQFHYCKTFGSFEITTDTRAYHETGGWCDILCVRPSNGMGPSLAGWHIHGSGTSEILLPKDHIKPMIKNAILGGFYDKEYEREY